MGPRIESRKALPRKVSIPRIKTYLFYYLNEWVRASLKQIRWRRKSRWNWRSLFLWFNRRSRTVDLLLMLFAGSTRFSFLLGFKKFILFSEICYHDFCSVDWYLGQFFSWISRKLTWFVCVSNIVCVLIFEIRLKRGRKR